MRVGSIFSSLNISASALSVQRQRMDVIAKNLANVDTTRTEEGGPYQREVVIINESKPWKKFNTFFQQLKSRLRSTHPMHFSSSEHNRENIIESGGVNIDQIAKDNSTPRLVYDPQHPDADEQGYVRKPNINVITEMVDIISATRAYEANLTVVDATKKINRKSLEI